MRLLDRDVFFFTTFGGEALSLAAALATMRALEDRQVPAYLAALGARLTDGYNRLTEWLGMSPYTRCAGPSCRTMVSFDAGKVPALEVKSLVQQELIRRGILWSGTHTLCGAHRDEDIDTLLGAYEDLLPEVARAVERGRVADRLLGDPVEPVFRRIGRDSPRPRS
jgi:glutamate-1-semialdehyde aminotransferase